MAVNHRLEPVSRASISTSSQSSPESSQSGFNSLPIVNEHTTTPNTFGLIRKYFLDTLPSHDPKDYLDLQALSDEPTPAVALPLGQRNSFSPYPNQSAFLLGDWYWNNGPQKSQESFSQLLHIIGHPEFSPEDVQGLNWSQIDAKLGRNNFDSTDEASNRGDEEWLDEDAGWHMTPIFISVPFHNRVKVPGTKDYLVGNLYHCSLVAIICEQLANEADVRLFHYEPFQLLWNCTGATTGVHVHGELYTSPVFLEAHRALQASPQEPGCDLLWVVVAMMFWSDATHLTMFGTTKLWLCYMYFSNESKYNQCKPSCHLCDHVLLPECNFHFVSL